MTIDDAITAVANNEAGISEVALESRLRIRDGNTLVTGDSTFRLDDPGLRQFCEQVSAPATYMQDLPGRIRNDVLQYHLDCCDLSKQPMLFVRNGTFLAFGNPQLTQISGRDVLEAVVEGARRELLVHALVTGESSYQVDLLVENASVEPVRGDVIRAGLRVAHSNIGEHATRVEAFVLRLVCSNGMTHRDCVYQRAARTRRLPTSRQNARDLQKEQVRRLASDAASSLDRKLDAIQNLRRDQVNVDHMMSRFLQHGGMSTRRWLPVLRKAWQVEGSETTAYGVMNAFTRVATHGASVSSRHRRILGGLAGVLAFRQLHICPRCFSHLRGPAGGDEPSLN